MISLKRKKSGLNHLLSKPLPAEGSHLFRSVFAKRFTNWTQFAASHEFDNSAIHKKEGVLVIAALEHQGPVLDAFLADKRADGFHTWLKLVDPSRSSPKRIKHLIKSVYRRYGNLSYVILIGDAEYVPFHPGSIGNVQGREADPLYGVMTRNDRYPDLVIARIPIKTPLDLEVILTKNIAHRTNIQGLGVQRTLSIASAEGSPSDQERAMVLNTILENSENELDISYVHDPNLRTQAILDQFNKGLQLVNYLGHGTENSWRTGNFTGSDILRLDGSSSFPIVVSVACLNGRFSWAKSDSFAESWIKSGSLSNPMGAIAILASSTNQDWVMPTLGQKAITKIFAQQGTLSVGQLFYEGLFAVLNEEGVSADQTFQSWHSFGDPTLAIRSIGDD